MNHRTQTSRLMRRLGFVADRPDRPQIIPSKEATYWRHQPTETCVVTLHDTRYTEAQIVRTAISAAIQGTLRDIGHRIGSTIGRVRDAHEDQAVAFGRKEKP